MDATTYLQKLGLTDKESALYIAAMELGISSPASTIAKRAHVNRTTAYDVLETLVEKGLIITHKKKKSLLLRGTTAGKIADLLRRTKQKIRSPCG